MDGRRIWGADDTRRRRSGPAFLQQRWLREKAPATIARDWGFFLPGLEAGYRLGFGLLGLAALRGNGNVGHRSRVGSAVPVVLLSWNHHDIALGNR
jgi:hypothetical protein